MRKGSAQSSCVMTVRKGGAQSSCATVPVLFGARWYGISAAQWVPDFREIMARVRRPNRMWDAPGQFTQCALIQGPCRAAHRPDKFAWISIP